MLRKYKVLFQKKPGEICLAVILAIQSFLIAYSNLALIDQNLDCDNGKLFHHIRMMWQEKTLAIPEWSYTTTLEWDCTTLFALPLYGITGNIYLSCALSNILTLGILIAVIFFLFQNEDRIYPLLCANFICIPYRIGMLDYYNMLFFEGTQYIIKILIPLLLIGLLLRTESSVDQKKQKSFFVFSVLYLILFLVSSASSGIYVAACGVAPVWAAFIGYKFFRWEKFPKSAAVLLAGSLVCILLGIKINHMVMGGARGESMVLCNVFEIAIIMQSCFIGMFELFGGATFGNTAILSWEGIVLFVKLCMVAVMLICGIAAVKKCLKKQGNLRLLLLLSVFLWNYFVLNIMDVRAGSSTYEYRYHLIGMIPLMCVSVIMLVNGLRKGNVQQQKVLFACGVTVLLFLNMVSFRELFARGEQNAELKELCEYFKPQDVEIVYMYSGANDADICRVIDDSKLYIGLEDDGTTWAYDNYKIYYGGAMQTENVVVAVEDAKEDLGDSFVILDKELVRFDRVAGRSLYCFVE